MNTFWIALLTGLTTGGLSCLAVQGGLLASSVAEREQTQKKALVAMFLASKLIAYTLLGFGLGLLGSSLIVSPKVQGLMQIFTGLFMLATAARILDLHPTFRYLVLQPPKWLFRIIRQESRDTSLFSPAVLGFMTVFIPCGVTQAMMVLAIGSGDPLIGAGIMFAFTLGTSPIFFALGLTTLELIKRKAFAGLAAGVIALLAVLSINTGQVLRGSTHTLQNYWLAATQDTVQATESLGKVAGVNAEGKQEVTVNVTNSGYTSSATTLKAGVPVKLTLVSNNAQGCTRAFTIPSLNMSKVLPPNGKEVVEFTPDKPGRLAYTCSMGMYGGQFTVVN